MPFAPERRRPRKATFLALAALATTGAIAIACGIDAVATRDGPIVGGPDTGDDRTVVLPPEGGPELDARPDVVVDASEAGCPTGHGTMVEVHDAGGLTFCIDSTEVRNDAYGAFLSATDGGNVDASLPVACPAGDHDVPPNGAGDLPMTGESWCDAYAYCAWAGKRLCGKTSSGDASTGEWYTACTNGTSQQYPYGNTRVPTACVDSPTALSPVGSHPQCEGGVPGLFDMVGNVNEWIDNCSGTVCSNMGGSYATQGTCSADSPYGRTIRGTAFIGFRCCSDL